MGEGSEAKFVTFPNKSLFSIDSFVHSYSNCRNCFKICRITFAIDFCCL